MPPLQRLLRYLRPRGGIVSLSVALPALSACVRSARDDHSYTYIYHYDSSTRPTKAAALPETVPRVDSLEGVFPSQDPDAFSLGAAVPTRERERRAAPLAQPVAVPLVYPVPERYTGHRICEPRPVPPFVLQPMRPHPPGMVRSFGANRPFCELRSAGPSPGARRLVWAPTW